MDSMLLIGFAVIVVLGVVLLAGMGTLTRRRSGLDRAYYQRQWQAIEGFKNAGGPSLQLAVMEADKLLDHALRDRGFRGETMGERLKAASRAFSSTNNIWKAHKLRNRLAHESGVQLNRVWVEQALHSFKSGLKDLGAL